MLRTALCLALGATSAIADTYSRIGSVDALNYTFRVTLADETDEVAAEATIDLRLVSDGVTEVRLDLVGLSPENGRGMTVEAVTSGVGNPLRFAHEANQLRIQLGKPSAAEQRIQLTVRYRGTPASGLRIGPNKYGERTFFSDHWPDKARHWLPTIDHPYDKATGEFVVTAPAHYQVVSNGLLLEETDLPGGRRRTHWKQSVPIATWLYALGVARFAVQHVGEFDGKPIQLWLYPQDRDAGFRDFGEPTRHSLAFFRERIGPYPYEKLANVQSASVQGGMECASAIFYGEDRVKGQGALARLVAHEVAHQWWGNAVTEGDWDDVWLSEGFATYFTLLFVEHAYGRDQLLEELRTSRKTILAFEEKNPGYRIVHDNLSDMSKVITSHTYQKGAWTLHMLRGIVGTDPFWTGIREYYRRYRDGNASTDDLRRVMEETTGLDLSWFFQQWLYREGIPRLRGGWRYDAAAGQIEIELAQTQPGPPFRLPLEVGLSRSGGSASRIERLDLAEARQTFRIPVPGKPASVVLDPNLWILMESDFGPR